MSAAALFPITAAVPEPPPPPACEQFRGLPDLAALRTLGARPQWVCWAYRLRYPKAPSAKPARWVKMPINAMTKEPASCSDPSTWSTCNAAMAATLAHKFNGVGYVLTEDDGLGGVDLDKVRDPSTGVLTPWAADIVALGKTYCEISPSGRGLRLFTQGKPENAVKLDPAGVEIYRSKRYLSVTGQHLPGTPTEIRAAPRTLAALQVRVEEFRAALKAEAEKKQIERGIQTPAKREKVVDTFFARVNSAAFAKLEAWVEQLFWNAARRTGNGYRVSSDALGRDLEEDLSITPEGAKDFGVADQGDEREGRRSAIDLIVEWGHQFEVFERRPTLVEASLWVCNQLEIAPESLGWKPVSAERYFDPKAAAGASSDSLAPRRGRNDVKPIVKLLVGRTSEAIDAVEQAIIARGGLYQRANRIVYIGEAPVITHKRNEVGVSRIMERSEFTLGEDIESAVCLMHFDKKCNAFVVLRPPSWFINTLQGRKGQFRLPVLTTIVNAPTLRPDGTVLSVPGYDQATGLFFDARGVTFPKLPDRPTRHDALQALATLNELLGGFSFKTDADRTVALSAVITACTRSAYPSAPLHGFSAPVAGAGKGKLVDIAAVIATGREAGVTAQVENREEAEKQLATQLLSGASVISLDNCTLPVDGNLLCAAVVQPVVSLRPFGKLEAVEVPSTAFLTATGNNLVISGDMTRRAIKCEIDPRVERPELREFSFDPVERAKADRVLYVSAVLTIVTAYKAAGSPPQVSVLGSFEGWSRTVRDALLWVGCADPVSTMEAARRADPKLKDLAAVLLNWRGTFGTDKLMLRDVIDRANRVSSTGFECPDLREALMAVAARGGVINSRVLGTWLGTQVGRFVDGWCIEQAGLYIGNVRWHVVPQ